MNPCCELLRRSKLPPPVLIRWEELWGAVGAEQVISGDPPSYTWKRDQEAAPPELHTHPAEADLQRRALELAV